MGNDPLPYEIVHCSSWDDDYNPEQLVKSSPGNQQVQPIDGDPLLVKCRGWQTPKCPEYPQDLIIHLLSGPSRIHKVQILSHHFKIATRIDVYMGILKEAQDVLEDIAPDTPPPDDQDNMLIEFTRLGYVCFDNNARAQFRARELKSIKLNADGEYLRFVIRNCHRNRLNAYNQVGILALNILGQPVDLRDKIDGLISNSSSVNQTSSHARHHFDDNSMLSSSTRRTSVSSSQSLINQLPTISVAEMELSQWSSALLHAEEEAVGNESYQIAKTYKYLGDKLERFVKILSDLEIGKRHAVETKDYDEAEKIKDDIKEIKQAAELMLKHANIQIENDGRVTTLLKNSGEPDKKSGTNTNINTTPEEEEDGMTLPVLPQTEDLYHLKDESLYHNQSHYIEIEDQDIDITIPSPSTIIPTVTAVEDPESIPEPITDVERIPCTLSISVFGEDIVACILSVKSKCRTRGLSLISHKIESIQQLAFNNRHEDICKMSDYYYYQDEHSHEQDEEDLLLDDFSRSISCFINATLMMLQEAIIDSRESIVSMTISIWHDLNELYKSTKIQEGLIIDWTERTFSVLLKRTGDIQQKIKNAASSLVIVLIQTMPILVTLYVCKPERLIHNHKEAKCRVELVELTVIQLSVEGSKLKSANKVSLTDLMAFVTTYLSHTHEDVRQAAVKLVVTISDQIGFSKVSPFINETLRVSLAETVKKLIEKDLIYSTKALPKDRNTLSELRALAVQPKKKATTLSTNRSKKPATTTTTTTTITTTKPPVSSKPTSEKRTASSKLATNSSVAKKPASASRTATSSSRVLPISKEKTTKEPRKMKTQPVREPPQPESEVLINENSVCVFCDEVNPEFNEDTLINHYYNKCPVLTNCSMCQTITEIATLNEHMLIDCEKKHLIKECAQCHQAIPVEQWLQHTLKQVCNRADPEKVHCPLCSINIDPPNDLGWKEHLMTGEGCTKLKRSRAPKKAASNSLTKKKK